MLPWNRRVILQSVITDVDLSKLEPQLDVSIDSKLEAAVEASCQKQVETNLQIHTVTAKLDAYMSDINQKINGIEDKLMLALRKDMKKVVKTKATKDAKDAKDAMKSKSTSEEKEDPDVDDINDDSELVI